MTNAATPTRRYRGLTKQQLSAERRQRLLEAAIDLFATEGYANVAIERVRAAARVATRHFYEHFPSREALLGAVFDQFIADAMALTTKALRAPGEKDPIEAALEALRAFSHFCMANPARARIALVETVGVSRELERRRRRVIGRFAGVIAAAADRLAGEQLIPRSNYRLAGVALVGATNELLIEWLAGETGLSAAQMERQVVALFEAIIRGAKWQAGGRRGA